MNPYLNLSISLTLASAYTDFPLSAWLSFIQQGLVLPTNCSVDKVTEEAASVIEIPLSCLPRYAQAAYLKDYLSDIDIVRLNLIGCLDKGDLASLNHIYDDLALLRAVEHLRRQHPNNSQPYIQKMLAGKNISTAAYYRKEQIYMLSDARKLVQGPKCYHSRFLCPLSEHYIVSYYSLPNHPYQNDILKMLTKESLERGPKICSSCVFNPASKKHSKWLSAYPDSPICDHAGDGMLYPHNRYPVNEFLKNVPPDLLELTRNGKNAWEAYCAPKTIRDKCSYANEAFYADHHLADTMVIVKDFGNGKYILARPWLTVLTDAATNAIVGSVVSLRANSRTIMECFCRAVAFTVDSPFYGIPKYIYCDNGKDYRSEMLKGIDPESRFQLPEQPIHLNRDFSENRLLEMLNVTVIHAKVRSGRSKVIENTFGILEKHWFPRIPGWCGNCPSNRPFDFEKEKKRLLKKGELWTFEKFARYWFEELIPTYNNSVFDNSGAPITPSQEHPSPQLKYLSLEKINKLVPDWDSLSVLKERKNEYAVQDNGVKYNGEVYWHPALEALKTPRGQEKKKVRVYDFDSSFRHSITLSYNGKFLCEAEPRVHHKTIESDRLKLALHLEEQKKARRNISRQVTMIHQSLKSSGVKVSRYVDYNPDSYVETDFSPVCVERIDELRNAEETQVLHEEAAEFFKIAKSRQDAIDKILYGAKETPLSDYFKSIGAQSSNE